MCLLNLLCEEISNQFTFCHTRMALWLLCEENTLCHFASYQAYNSCLAFYSLLTILVLDKLCQGSTFIPCLVLCYPSNSANLSWITLAIHVKIAMIFISRIIWCYVHCLDVVLGLNSCKTSKEKLRNAPRTLNWANRPKQVGQVQRAALIAQLGRGSSCEFRY